MSTEIVNVALSADTITLTAGAPSGQALIGNGTSFIATPPPAPTVGGGVGYVTLPGGLILQWSNYVYLGTGSSDIPVTFPISFTTTPVVMVNGWDPGGNGYVAVDRTSISTIGFSVHQGGFDGQYLTWLAIGT